MHELSIVFYVVKTVEDIALSNGLTKVDTIVLQIGELSSMVPRYVEECFPAAVHGTSLQETKLRIELIKGKGMCCRCGITFNLLDNSNICPECGSKKWELISGKEFSIKEIIAS